MALVGSIVRARIGIAAVALVLIAIGCDGGSDPPPPPLAVNPGTATIPVGGTWQYTARNASGAVSWSSSDDDIASVLATGFVTGRAPGQATITATDSRGSATAVVIVQRPASLVLSTAALAFTAQAGGADPAAQTVQVTDGGDERVSAIAVQGIAYASGQPTGWLTASVAGTAAPTQLTVRPSPGTLPTGVYSATISVSATGASNGPQTVVVTFTVAAAPSIALSRAAVAMAATPGANPAPETVEITNAGGGALAGLAATVAYGAGQPTGWLAAVIDAGTAVSTLTLTATTAALATGTYTATVSVAAAGASNSPQQVAVTLAVGPPPSIVLAAATADFAATVGGASPAAQTIAVTNGGGGSLGGLAVGVTYAQGQPGGWLTTATLDRTTAPAVLTLRPTTGALAAGTYTATVAVSAASATNSPRSIAVTFTVGQAALPPSIALSRATVSMAGSVGGANPGAETVDITNGGGGTLAGLTATVIHAGGQPAGWLAATLGSATAPTTLTLQATTGALAAGTYDATVSIAAAGASNSPRSVTVTFVVGGPGLVRAPGTLTFAANQGAAQPAAQNVSVTATSGTIGGLGATTTYTSGAGWLTISLSGPTTPASLSVRPSTTGLAPGTYQATVNILSPNASNSPVTVAVSYTVQAAPPTIVLGSSSISVSRTRGSGAGTQTQIAITNGGGGTLTGLDRTISYASGAGWLTATLDATTAPTTLRITPNVTGLARGTYTATVSVTAPGAGNTPQAIAVQLTVLWSLANDVFPAITAYCSGCHFAGGNVPNLTTATLFYDNLVNVPTAFKVGYPLATTYPLRIVPGSVTTSYVMYQVNKVPGAHAMPTTAVVVPLAVRDALAFWISQNAPRP